jgi:hypothetical protein
MLYKTTIQSASAIPKKPITPKGPTVQENYGSASPCPAFQDLIKSPYDESLFEFFTKTQLVKNVNGVETKINIPAFGFNATVSIYDMSGKLVKELVKLPASETAPAGNDNVQDVPRAITWRDDEAATVVWCKPLDGGLIKNNAD